MKFVAAMVLALCVLAVGKWMMSGPASTFEAAMSEGDREGNYLVGDEGSGSLSLRTSVGVSATVAWEEALQRRAEGEWSPSVENMPGGWAVGMPAGEVVDVLIDLDDIPFDWPGLRRQESEAMADAMLAQRRQDVETKLEPLIKRLVGEFEAAGIEKFWVSPGLRALVPAGNVPRIAVLADVRDVRKNIREGGPAAAYDGDIVEVGMRTRDFLSTYQGGTGGRAGGAIRLGVIEWATNQDGTSNFPARGHSGLKIFGASRIAGMWNCTANPCQVDNSTDDDGSEGHMTKVMRVAGGSVESGQDADVTSTSERRRRSGLAMDVRFYIYRIDSAGALQRAIDMAVGSYVDVANHSYDLSCSQGLCNASCDNANGHIKNSTNSGILHVAAHGNQRHDGGISGACNASYPAIRREVLSVPALATTDSTLAYDTRPSAIYSSLGGMTIKTVDGVTRQRAFAIADLSAPGDHTFSYNNSSQCGDGNMATGYTTSTMSGTSLSAPAVAGAAVMLKDAFNDLGWGMQDARGLKVNMLLMGDGYAFFDGIKMPTAFDSVSGAGRVHMHYPATVTVGTSGMYTPWGWGWHYFDLHPGEVKSFDVWDSGAENPNVKQWKGVMTWEEADYNNVADIIFSVYDTCPAGGGSPALIRRDLSYDIRKRITLYQNEIVIGGLGRCLQYRVEAWNIPTGTIRTVYTADYFHGGSTNDH